MNRNFLSLGNKQFDLLVCGGGIYGAWTAYDAALRGLKVALVEQGDWAEATYWETLAMSIVNELYYRALMQKYSPFERELVESDGKIALGRKIRELLNGYSIENI